MRNTIKTAIAATVLASCGFASAPVQAQERYLGEIFTFGGTFCPRGSLSLDGQLLSVASNSALFSLVGTIYGGDGRTTFGLPDLRGRSPMHTGTGAGLSPRPIGQRFGSESYVLSANNLPSHTHTAHVNVARVNATVRNPISSAFARDVANAYDRDNAPDSNFRMSAGTVTLDSTGNNSSVNNMQPFMTLRYCMMSTGIYPSRS